MGQCRNDRTTFMIYSITQPYFDWSIIPVTMGLNGYSKMWIP